AHAGCLAGGGGVDAAEAGVGVRAADERGVQQPGPGEVAGETAPAEQHPAVFLAGQRGAHPLAHRGTCPLASASARATRVTVSRRRKAASPCVSSGGSIWPAACSPIARQVPALAGCPLSGLASTSSGRGPTPPRTTRPARQMPSATSAETAAATTAKSPWRWANSV